MNLLAINIPCWIIPILVGLISAILGYLLGRLLGGGNDSSNNDIDVDVYKNRISKLEADLAACKASKTSNFSGGNSASSGAANFAAASPATTTTESSSGSSSAALAAGTVAAAFNADAAKAIFGKKIKENDLTVVEGIGPKIQELFHNHDVNTWAKLADCSIEKCTEVLKSGGKRFEMHKPGTWPDQSRLAAAGKWQELKDLQSRLDGGR